MRELSTYDYAVIRVVPRVDRHEFINVGVILSCPDTRFLGCRIELDEERLLALHPGADVESIRNHLETIQTICKGGEEAGPIGKLTQRERFHFLVSPRSTVIQPSPPHVGRTNDPEATLEQLMNTMVRTGTRVDTTDPGASPTGGAA